jgi:hypothetical protein
MNVNEPLAVTGLSLKCVDLRLEYFMFADNQCLDAPSFTPSGSHWRMNPARDAGASVVVPRHAMWEN